MQKAMVFIDFENFNIAITDYYNKDFTERAPRLDYNLVPSELINELPNHSELVKTFLFAPKPDDFLMQDEKRKKCYDWINGLKNQKYFTVIEGEHSARPTHGYTYDTMNIDDPRSYYVVEKGTDINLSAHLITKAFHNSFDTAVIVSGDSDYIPVLDILNTMGKTTISVGVKGQNLFKLRRHSDDIVVLDRTFFDKCLRK
ncbi:MULTISPECIES: NYN domain-containing protein [Caproicibacterium]|uniref:NYN domain-containing protein n=1 Tax=Caproicibacterium argilliputei TaxID=3030016 RepID=A0AA97DBT0_9FIRM|nr:NYN domain-containing protein [Caproicibacterium argilliputei]WOC32872.1 NYN domain-containing protein [Caproicibacterium argilliputei]